MSDNVEDHESEAEREEPQPVVQSFPPPTDNIIEQWFNDHFPGSAVARNAECWNLVAAAKEKLKEMLR